MNTIGAELITSQGSCGFCGAKYAAHRTVEAQMERVAAGESWDDVAADYGQTVEQMVDTWHALVVLLVSEEVTA